MQIKYNDLSRQYELLKKDINVRINSVLEHGQYIMGPEVIELEIRLSKLTGSKYCFTVSSGTDALLISLLALDIKPGDEVITTPFTFAATVEVIMLLGAKPVFVDIEHTTCNINPKLIEKKITNRTKAIIPVSLFGQTADMDAINRISKFYDSIPVIEDAAQSFGATYRGKKSCNLSTIGCTSFFPSKPLGCYGDGGAIFTNDDELASKIKEIRIHGQSSRYVHERLGLCARMDTIQCAIILSKLKIFEWELKKRKEVGIYYDKLLDDLGVNHIDISDGNTSAYAQYTIISPERDCISNYLNKNGIPTSIHYPIPLNKQKAYSNQCCPDCTPVAELMSRQVLSLPFSPYILKKDQLEIVNHIQKYLLSRT
jgi:UDP-2-acetamido-2-deoxy-ribo-hexuluronate aminotransferase